MQTPKRIGWSELKKDFPNFGNYGKLHYQLPLVYGEAQLIESAILMEIVHSVNPKKILEIGRCRGSTSLNLALASNAQVTTLDLLIPEEIYKDSNSKIAHELWEKHGVSERITEILVDSAKFETDETFELIWVDGGHDFEQCCEDIQMSLELLEPRGVCLIHDFYKRSFPGVTGAIALRAEELDIKWICNDFEFLNTSICYFIKK